MTTVNRDPISSGTVSQCQADDCSYNNQQGQCNAGAVYFNVVEGQASCYTYTTDDIQQAASEVKEAGQVAQCSVIDCAYNEVQACIADSITVSVSDNMAKCNDYKISDDF